MLHLSPNKITFWFRTILMAVIAFSTTAGLASEQLDKSEPAKTLPVAGNSTTDCAGCHKIETQLWQQSHHARAMAEATRLASDGSRRITEAVLGDFNDAQAEDFALTANFRTVDGYPVMALTRERSTTHHIVSYSFGSTPLQQYLTDTDNGRQQVLPFAWDSRPKERGGQRWITLHPEEDILPADRLHWEQPLANWNGMCADCHSSGLTRNYSSADNSFATQYSDINVSCASCHSADPHNNNPIAAGSAAGFPTRYPLASSGSGSGSASASVMASSTPTSQTENSKRTLEVCAGCHSLRAPLVDGIDPTQPFLDQFSPTWLNPTLYFADGQIREEVYVWGSFLQSRMHEEGVTCGNCHDPHSQQLKAKGNALCGQCHIAETFDSPNHHKHKPQSTGAQCVNCHMTSRTYMVVDDRRDHSFRVPDPTISHALGSPDACTSCHQGKSQNWASAALADWSSEKQATKQNPGRASSTKQAWQLHQSGVPLSPDQFKALLADEQLPELLRASAVVQQAQLQPATTEPQLRALLRSNDPLVVLATTISLANLPPASREKLLLPLASHRYRAIRIAAANQLRDTPAAALTKTPSNLGDGPEIARLSNQALAKALTEADMADTVSSWRGEGAMNSALSKQRSADDNAAIEAYRHAIAIDPYFEPSYINLTELYRRQGDARREQLLYTAALKALPDSPLLRYSYALHLVRRKDPAQALVQTTKALTIAPASQNNAYLHLLLLDNLGETHTSVEWLRANLSNHQHSPQVLQIGAKHAQKLGDTQSLALFLQALQASSQPTK